MIGLVFGYVLDVDEDKDVIEWVIGRGVGMVDVEGMNV